jgi:hypothetical protein
VVSGDELTMLTSKRTQCLRVLNTDFEMEKSEYSSHSATVSSTFKINGSRHPAASYSVLIK